MKDVSEQKKKSAPEAKGATAVRKFHTHSIPLDMEDIARDWEKPVVDAGNRRQSQRDCTSRHVGPGSRHRLLPRA